MKKIVSVLMLLCMLLGLCGCNGDPAATTTPTIDPSLFNPTGPLYDRKSYSVADDVAISARSKVVAHVGDTPITNGFLQLAYWSGFFTYMDERGSWAASQGLVYNEPLDTQIMPRSTCTWQHYFLRNVLESLHDNYALYNEATLLGIPLPKEMLDELEQIPQTLQKTAEDAGYPDALSYVQMQHGPGTTVEDFCLFMRVSYVSTYYFNTTMDNLEITEEDIEAYMQLLIQEGVTRDESTVYHIRHILFEVKEDGTEEDWQKAEQDAKKVLADWLAGEHTEESFGELAMEHSDDMASVVDGGRYRGVLENNTFAQEFKDWFMTAGRKNGDYGIVKTEFGYHIMYYIGSEAKWHYDCTNGVRNTAALELMDTVREKHPLTVVYNDIALGVIDPSKSVA